MNEWSWVIAPVIALVLFLLSRVLKPEEPARPAPPPVRPARRPVPAPRQQEQQPEGMQRFLEEIQRMREGAAAKKQDRGPDFFAEPPPLPADRPVERPKPVVVEQRAQRRQQPTRPRPTPSPRPRRQPQQPEVPVLVLAADEDQPPSAARVVLAAKAAPRAATAVPVIPAEAPLPATAAATRIASRASPAAEQLLALLKSRNSLAVAVMLKEVLDKPVCLRRRGERHLI